jgi:hypothetical protein
MILALAGGRSLARPSDPERRFFGHAKFLALKHVALCHVVARCGTSFMVEFA